MDAMMLLGEVERPVRVEVPVVLQGAEFQDGLGAFDAPPGAGDVETITDQVPACAFDGAIKLHLLLPSFEFVLGAGTRRVGLEARPRSRQRRGCRPRRWP